MTARAMSACRATSLISTDLYVGVGELAQFPYPFRNGYGSCASQKVGAS